LYERLGIKEYFVFATDDRAGKLIAHYLLMPGEGILPAYKTISLAQKDKTVPIETLTLNLPIHWKI